MKEILKRYWKSILIFGIVGIIIIPLCIHICFKISVPCEFLNAVWTAGDVLSFYGVIIGSIATVGGVYLSIQYSRQNYNEDVKKRVLPFIALTSLRVKSKWDALGSVAKQDISSDEDYYDEYVLEKVYFIIENGKVSVKSELTKEQAEKVSHRGHIWKDCGSYISLVDINLLSAPLVLENVGNGVANLMRVGFNKESANESEYQYLSAIPFKVGQKLYVHIYCENRDDSNVGNYLLDVNYEDIYKNKYRQRYALVITKANDTKHSYMQLDGKQEQVKINRSDIHG